MYYSSEVLERVAKDRLQDLRKEAAMKRCLPSYRQRLAALLMSVARWLEPELVESAPTPQPLSR